MGEVRSLRRERYVSMTGYSRDLVPAPVPFWRKPVSIFGLVLITTFIESSPVFTIPCIQPHLRLMLADTPSPHGSVPVGGLWGPCPAAPYRALPFRHSSSDSAGGTTGLVTTCQTINLATSCRNEKLSGPGLCLTLAMAQTAVAHWQPGRTPPVLRHLFQEYGYAHGPCHESAPSSA